MGQQSKDNIQDGYSGLHNAGYELLAIDMTNSDSVTPSLVPVFGSKNVKSYTTDMTADTMAGWIQDRICRIKYSESIGM
ncbi:hypothetical protein OESDEN_25603 [Oesophagostomum dentatum]|uniref:Uncharacterized protein n=1 Tax=Oesophagostomum dentatum TaxID=61180 RepID=A0A0B1RT09_OESDE|nr:hypothetical protein OESDEN_25603 [Oesophagostomum dentatum]